MKKGISDHHGFTFEVDRIDFDHIKIEIFKGMDSIAEINIDADILFGFHQSYKDFTEDTLEMLARETVNGYKQREKESREENDKIK